MKIYAICFTQNGVKMLERIKASDKLKQHQIDGFLKMKHCKGDICPEIKIVKGELKSWIEEAFTSADALLFIGACGIAVRGIAPFLEDKFRDPAVVVLDELGLHCISILSGHVGGGNALTLEIAEAVGAEPVITTATDINDKFAVDVFATEHGLEIIDRELAKEVSAAMLAGIEVPVFWEKQKQEVRNHKEENFSLGIYIGIRKYSPFEKTLYLVPKVVAVGIGCKAGTTESQIRKVFYNILKEAGIFPEAVKTIATIALKKEEPGLLDFCKSNRLPMKVYEAEELESILGEFHSSEFVQKVTGVDNVCERSACLAAGYMVRPKALLIEKKSGHGIAIAAAEEDWEIEQK